MYSSVKKMMVVMAALFVSSLAAQEASAAMTLRLYKKNETATKVDVKLKATASQKATKMPYPPERGTAMRCSSPRRGWSTKPTR